jgi:hypothetical protein
MPAGATTNRPLRMRPTVSGNPNSPQFLPSGFAGPVWVEPPRTRLVAVWTRSATARRSLAAWFREQVCESATGRNALRKPRDTTRTAHASRGLAWEDRPVPEPVGPLTRHPLKRWVTTAANGDEVGRIVGPPEGSRKDVVGMLSRVVAAHTGLAGDYLSGDTLPICIPVGHTSKLSP